MFIGKGNMVLFEGLYEIIKVGVVGMKLYEDWGIILVVIDNCFIIVEEYDVVVIIYTDTFNELCCVEKFIEVFKGCIIYMYYFEGVGGGYVLDIIKVCGEKMVFFLFTNLIRLYIKNIVDEYLDMFMVCYYFDFEILEDVVFVELCICVEIIVVEDVFYDMGVFSIMVSDL